MTKSNPSFNSSTVYRLPFREPTVILSEAKNLLLSSPVSRLPSIEIHARFPLYALQQFHRNGIMSYSPETAEFLLVGILRMNSVGKENHYNLIF